MIRMYPCEANISQFFLSFMGRTPLLTYFMFIVLSLVLSDPD